jgi:transcriptional regulator with XRE-family HTH domain
LTLSRAGRRSKLTPDLIAKVGRLAALGLSQKHIAEACKVTPEHFSRWLTKGQNDETESTPEYQLAQVFHEASLEGEMRLLQRIADGDTRDAQWLLSRSPRWRHKWSENAAITRAYREGVSAAIDSIADAKLAPDVERNVLLRITARTGVTGEAS